MCALVSTERPAGQSILRSNPASDHVPPSWALDTCAAWWPQLESASRSVLMLDYDGTLAPFVRERMQAMPYPGVPERLHRLAREPRTRLVLISGRPVHELVRLLAADLHVEIWGSHGRERLYPDGTLTAAAPSPEQQGCLDQLESMLEERGLTPLVEKKVGSLAIHTRGLAAAEAQEILAFAHNFQCTLATGEDAAGVEWLPFDGGLELRASGCTKATAVRAILQEEPPEAPAAYLGDDLTDEDAFRALQARDLPARSSRASKLCVLVRTEPRASSADLWLKPPDELLAFLDRWIAAVAGPGSAQ